MQNRKAGNLPQRFEEGTKGTRKRRKAMGNLILQQEILLRLFQLHFESHL
jgi:hypothetical protein